MSNSGSTMLESWSYPTSLTPCSRWMKKQESDPSSREPFQLLHQSPLHLNSVQTPDQALQYLIDVMPLVSAATTEKLSFINQVFHRWCVFLHPECSMSGHSLWPASKLHVPVWKCLMDAGAPSDQYRYEPNFKHYRYALHTIVRMRSTPNEQDYVRTYQTNGLQVLPIMQQLLLLHPEVVWSVGVAITRDMSRSLALQLTQIWNHSTTNLKYTLLYILNLNTKSRNKPVTLGCDVDLTELDSEMPTLSF